MTRLLAGESLTAALSELLSLKNAGSPCPQISLEPLPSSRPVYRLVCPESGSRAVGKFFLAYPPGLPADRGLVREYGNYLWAAELGLSNGLRLIPRLLGCRAEVRLGLLLEDIPGPDLDRLLLHALSNGGGELLYRGLENLAGLLAFFHTRPVPDGPASPEPALNYLDRLQGQLMELGLLTPEDEAALEGEKVQWEAILNRSPESQVLVHGDATPTNFLFPDGRVVALDLERLGVADRLWDLSWVAGEVKHAWGWRTGDLSGAEPYIRHFLASYLNAVQAAPELSQRVFRLNPFYMALAELRIARNGYLSWTYRLTLIAEARRCLYFGRRM
jgi:aminoglycoside phosphotransferase